MAREGYGSFVAAVAGSGGRASYPRCVRSGNVSTPSTSDSKFTAKKSSPKESAVSVMHGMASSDESEPQHSTMPEMRPKDLNPCTKPIAAMLPA